MSRSKSEPATNGPSGYQNWRAVLLRQDDGHYVVLGMHEVQLYSDAHLVGACNPSVRCPYLLLNAFPFMAIGTFAHVLTLRTVYWTQQRSPNWSRTDSSRYHGGRLVDEITALTSLLLGVRLQAGGVTREFNLLDELGVPRGDTEAPASPLPVLHHHERWRIPSARTQRNLAELIHPLFETYPLLKPEEAISLVRAARLYQRALWVCETTPELAWLHLVSAIEVLAVHEHCEVADDVRLLADAMPELHTDLTANGGQHLIEICAGHLAKHLKSTRRFLEFLKKFGPENPPPRPEGAVGTIAWDQSGLKKRYAKVYEYRSNALHSGEPFPAPMNEPAGDGPRYSETIHVNAQHSQDAVWLSKDIPMRLHVFEYVTRTSLLAWWTHKANL